MPDWEFTDPAELRRRLEHARRMKRRHYYEMSSGGQRLIDRAIRALAEDCRQAGVEV